MIAGRAGRFAALAVTAVVGGVAVAPAAMAANVDSSPHYYSADGTTADSDGSGNLTGTVAYVPVAGSYAGDEAFSFNGGDSLSAPNDDVANFGTTDFTLSFRFATTSNTRQDLLSKRGDGCNGFNDGPLIDIRTNPSEGAVDLDVADTTFLIQLHVASSFADGKYHTVTATRAGTSVTETVDGVSASTTSISPLDLDTDVPLTLASGPCTSFGTTDNLTGELDALRITPDSPPAALPEAHDAVVLALAGMGVLGAAYALRRRRAD